MQKNVGTILVVLVMLGGLLFAADQYALEKDSKGTVDTKRQTVRVESVADGDTIRVFLDGETKLVRVIGIDTPEVNGPNTKEECYGREASDIMNAVVTGKNVTLEYDESQGRLDKYDRVLAHVFLGVENVGALLIEGGHAKEYTYRTPHAYTDRYRELEAAAQLNSYGLWDTSMCP